MKYEFSTKLNSRKNSAGVTIEKVRVWLEESKNNRFLSDAGFVRGAAVDIEIDQELNEISISLLHTESGRYWYGTTEPRGKHAKVAGKQIDHYSTLHVTATRCPQLFILKTTRD